MIRLSTRFAAVLLLLAGSSAALRLTLVARTRGEDPCASPGALRATTLIPGSVALGERRESLGASTFQWSEGEVANPVFDKLPMRFQIVRSFEATSLYGNPLAFAEDPRFARTTATEASSPRTRLQPEELRTLAGGVGETSLPIHLAWDHTEAPRGPSRFVAWFFMFDNRPVRSPLAAQIASAPSLVVGGPRPLTLVTISALATQSTASRVEAAAIAWLEGAWTYAARVCGSR